LPSLESDTFALPSVRLPFNANVGKFFLFCEKDVAGNAALLSCREKCLFLCKKESQMNFSMKNVSQHILPNRWERPKIFVIVSCTVGFLEK